jgi:hypothetical protein
VQRSHHRAVPAAALLVVAVLLTACTGQPSPPNTSTTGTLAATTVIVSPPPVGTTVRPAPTTTSATAPGDAPPVTRLTWLDGRSKDPGVELAGTDGRTRWQSAVPGEYALLAPAGYDWFGANGAMVGCTRIQHCVGIDAAGYTAVVTAADRMRLVYGPDGNFHGRFDRAGHPLPGGGPSLSAALTASGVDVAALVDEAGRPVPFAGGVTGDPHVISLGGVRLTTQQTGEFQARAGDPDRPIQLRFEPMAHRRDVSVVTDVAVLVAGVAVEFTDTGRLSVGGEPVSGALAFQQIPVADGAAAIGLWRPEGGRVSRLAVVWWDGGTVSMTADPALGMTVVAQLPPRAGISGLFGTDRDVSDLRTRRGLTDTTEAVVTSWQLSPEESSLFVESVPPVSGFPQQVAQVPPTASAAAEQACTAAGVLLPADRDACVFDIALTGDDGLAAGHGELATVAERPPYPPGLADRWPALAAGFTGSPSDLPPDGRLTATLAPGDHLVYRLDVLRAGQVSLRHVTACVDPSRRPASGETAARIFDRQDRPVSERFAMCGRKASGTLQPGRYVLVLDGPTTGVSVPVELSVTVP